MCSLLAHENRMHRFIEHPLEQAFQAKLKFSNNGDNKNKNGYGKIFQKAYNCGWGRESYKNQGTQK